LISIIIIAVLVIILIALIITMINMQIKSTKHLDLPVDVDKLLSSAEMFENKSRH
jgi:uncharacterized membrane protein